jgi:hypothetical protein
VELSDLNDLHYIIHIDNLSSILQHGIVCHKRAKLFDHISVASPAIQERRKNKLIPGSSGLSLHEYVNLYINARNPMLYTILDSTSEFKSEDIGILSVSTDILFLPEVIITDCNAARDLVTFNPSPSGLKKLDKNLVFAKYWNDPDPIQKDKKKGAICAEVLVPHRVAPSQIKKIYVSNTTAKTKIDIMGISLDVVINHALFFNK